MVFWLNGEKSFGFSYLGMNCGFEFKGKSLEWEVLRIHAKEGRHMSEVSRNINIKESVKSEYNRGVVLHGYSR